MDTRIRGKLLNGVMVLSDINDLLRIVSVSGMGRRDKQSKIKQNKTKQKKTKEN